MTSVEMLKLASVAILVALHILLPYPIRTEETPENIRRNADNIKIILDALPDNPFVEPIADSKSPMKLEATMAIGSTVLELFRSKDRVEDGKTSFGCVYIYFTQTMVRRLSSPSLPTLTAMVYSMFSRLMPVNTPSVP
jgi:hypothetical protein